MLLPGCGIRNDSRTLAQLAAVTHVVHGAASITFTDHIFKSLATNYQAPPSSTVRPSIDSHLLSEPLSILILFKCRKGGSLQQKACLW